MRSSGGGRLHAERQPRKGGGGVAATAAARALESATAQPDDSADVEGTIGCVCASTSTGLTH